MQYRRMGLSLVAATIAEVFNKLVPFIILRIAMQRLGVASFGESQYLLWIIDLCTFGVVCGFHHYGSIELGRSSRDQESSNRLLSAIILAKLAHAAVIFAIIGSWALLANSETLTPTSLAIVGLALLFSALDMYVVQVGRARLASYSIAFIIAKCANLIGVWLIVNDSNDANLFALCAVASNIVVTVFSILVAAKDFRLIRINWSEFARHWRASLTYAPILLLLVAVERFDLYFVKMYFNAETVGHYTAASRIVQSVIPIIMVFGGIFFAEMVQISDVVARETHLKASIELLVGTIFPVVVGIWLFAGEIFAAVYGISDPEGIRLLRILGFLLIGHSILYIFGYQMLPLLGKAKWVNLVLGIGLVAGVVCSYVVNPNWGPTSIAWISVIVRCSAALGCLAFAMRFIQMPLIDVFFRSAIPSIAAMSLASPFQGRLVSVWIFLCVIFFLTVGLNWKRATAFWKMRTLK